MNKHLRNHSRNPLTVFYINFQTPNDAGADKKTRGNNLDIPLLALLPGAFLKFSPSHACTVTEKQVSYSIFNQFLKLTNDTHSF